VRTNVGDYQAKQQSVIIKLINNNRRLPCY
jgi:hypothetical protein